MNETPPPPRGQARADDAFYRRNVGIALFNRDGLAFVGHAKTGGPEIVTPGRQWQMP